MFERNSLAVNYCFSYGSGFSKPSGVGKINRKKLRYVQLAA